MQCVVTMEISVPIGELKVHCYQILDEATRNNNKLIITKRGKAIAEVTPLQESRPKRSIFGALRDLATVNGDIVSSLNNVSWDAENVDK